MIRKVYTLFGQNHALSYWNRSGLSLWIDSIQSDPDLAGSPRWAEARTRPVGQTGALVAPFFGAARLEDSPHRTSRYNAGCESLSRNRPGRLGGQWRTT